jgi:hypothetical protein
LNCLSLILKMTYIIYGENDLMEKFPDYHRENARNQ